MRGLLPAFTGLARGLRRRCSPPMCESLSLYSGYHPSSGSRRRSRLSSQPPRPSKGFEPSEAPAEQRIESPEEHMIQEKEDHMVMRCIQDLVEGLSYNSPAALKELFELSCLECFQLGQRTQDAEKLWATREESFKKRGREIIRRNIDEGRVQARLLESLEGCYQSFHALQVRLDDAVHAKYRINDEEFEGDEHEPTALLKQPKEWHGTEAYPCHQRWVMDAEVEVADLPSVGRIPVPEKSVLLSNLPQNCKEETVIHHLSPCGQIAHIEFCDEWREMVEANRDEPETVILKDGRHILKSPPKFTLSYALVEFQEPEGRRRATRRLSRLQGILFREVQWVKLKTAWSEQVVARPCYPQDLRLKKSLLLRGLPIHMDPHEVLQAALLRLSGAQRSGRAELLNCYSFRERGGGPLYSLEVEVGADGQADVRQESQQMVNGSTDAACCPPGNGGELVLRFKSFQEAYVSRQLLQAMELGGRRIFAGFPPWRPQAVWTDCRGYDLEETRLMDLPVPRASARYSRHMDPVHKAPSNEEVDAMAQD